ncbi:MAG: hypothetical protein QOG44_1534 [Acidimicrobiaceae bacterium]|nr:hypothetical protein [Acidimicrobiaceae bacterium]
MRPRPPATSSTRRHRHSRRAAPRTRKRRLGPCPRPRRRPDWSASRSSGGRQGAQGRGGMPPLCPHRRHPLLVDLTPKRAHIAEDTRSILEFPRNALGKREKWLSSKLCDSAGLSAETAQPLETKSGPATKSPSACEQDTAPQGTLPPEDCPAARSTAVARQSGTNRRRKAARLGGDQFMCRARDDSLLTGWGAAAEAGPRGSGVREVDLELEGPVVCRRGGAAARIGDIPVGKGDRDRPQDLDHRAVALGGERERH